MFTTIKDFALESIAALLAFYYDIGGRSYGLAIILLTATVMVVLMPLTIKATRSTIKMTQLQPELKKLQKEYKDDRQQLNQEMMALYQANGVNPVGGCLPMLAQLPVFLVLFNVLRGLTRRVSEKPYFTVAEHAQGLLGGTTDASDNFFDPKYLNHDTVLFQDLEASSEMGFGPFDLAIDAWQVIREPDFVGSIVYVVLIAFVVGSSYYQQRQVSARRPNGSETPTPQQQTQQQLLRILPLMTGVWSFFFPAGLVLYWATSNVFRIGQQSYITRALYSGKEGEGITPAVIPDEKKKSNGSKAGRDKDKAKDNDLAGEDRPARKNRNGSSKNGSDADTSSRSGSRNGSDSGRSSSKADREEAWARRREQKTKVKEARKKTTAEGSSRTTPKGTKPTGAKKKRKR